MCAGATLSQEQQELDWELRAWSEVSLDEFQADIGWV